MDKTEAFMSLRSFLSIYKAQCDAQGREFTVDDAIQAVTPVLESLLYDPITAKKNKPVDKTLADKILDALSQAGVDEDVIEDVGDLIEASQVDEMPDDDDDDPGTMGPPATGVSDLFDKMFKKP